MKFPNHIILDLSTRDKDTTFTSWAIRFKNKTTPSLDPLQAYTSYNASKHANFSTISSYAQRNTYAPSKTTQPVYLVASDAPLNNPLWDIFNINFLRKEKIYTKLKYSRCPQYDIVSGGVAAIFSGFLGFLICEKFGLELLDSGDFYVFFMYAVFASFSLRPLLRIANKSDTLWHVFTLHSLYTFLRDLFILFLRFPSIYFHKFINKTNLNITSVTVVLWKFQYITGIYHFFRRLRIFLTNWPKKGYKTFREVK